MILFGWTFLSEHLSSHLTPHSIAAPQLWSANLVGDCGNVLASLGNVVMGRTHTTQALTSHQAVPWMQTNPVKRNSFYLDLENYLNGIGLVTKYSKNTPWLLLE